MSYAIDEMISDLEITNENLAFGENLPRGVRGCTLRGCNIAIDVPKGGPSIYRCKLVDCTIDVKRRMKDSSFFGSDYTRCKFKGKFLGMDFGRSPWPHPGTGHFYEFGELVDCDFTEATLDLCRFFNVDIARQKFAPWPQFVIPHNRELVAAGSNSSWPGKFAEYLAVAAQENPALAATTGTVAYFMKRNAITQEELQQALEKIGGVIR